jgi:hypothetical protein
MNTKRVGIYLILAIGMLTGLTATALTMAVPAVAGGDDHGEKKCKNNGDNNCNDKHKTQKIKAKNYCEIENSNEDHSKKNDNKNDLVCINEAQNLNDVFQELSEVNGNSSTLE